MLVDVFRELLGELDGRLAPVRHRQEQREVLPPVRGQDRQRLGRVREDGREAPMEPRLDLPLGGGPSLLRGLPIDQIEKRKPLAYSSRRSIKRM
jgi:hypothetical protein